MVQAHTDLLVKIVTRTAKGRDFADLFPEYETLLTFLLDNIQVFTGFGLELAYGLGGKNMFFIYKENKKRLWVFDRKGDGPYYRIIG